ncbi:MAG: hypothetical protein IPL34_20235 [Thiofilum sp.]|uniref:hypothetical protein n=1 Tax=Thiofilum sp. TaxID=2212733 RepID=UPI0025EF126B|nr:hypothetical protein [Thiofilum sp.]MBK8455611.1 hypothetical protein [Thiofilum sp.]
MAVVINAQTGLAEDLPEQDSLGALEAGTHEVALNDPDGNPVVAPYSEASKLVAQGYTQPNTEQLTSLLNSAKYGSGVEQVKTALEGAASAATFGASTGIETALGVDPEAIRARREENPVAYGAGEMAGLIGTSLIGVGEGAALARAGEAVGARIAGETVAARVGSGAARAMVENSIFQSGDEISKMFTQDPDQSIGSAAASVGLSGLIGAGIGGGIGYVSPLWKAVSESKLSQSLGSIKDRLNGDAPEIALAKTIATAGEEQAEKAAVSGVGPLSFGGIGPEDLGVIEADLGMSIPAEVRAGLSNDPTARGQFQVLMENNTSTAHKVQTAVNNFHREIDNKVLSSLGKTEADVAATSSLSAHEGGQKVLTELKSGIEERLKPINKIYEEVEKGFKDIPLDNSLKANIGNKIGDIVAEGKFDLVPGSEEQALINKLYEGLKNSSSIDDLRKVSEIINKEADRKQLYHIGRKVRDLVEESAENAAEAHMGSQGSPLLEKWLSVKPAYGALKREIGALNDELRVGAFRGPKGFLKNLSEMHPEQIISRLNPKNKAEAGAMLEGTFPKAAESLKSYLRDSLLKDASNKAKGDALINPKVFYSTLEKSSPEYRKFLLGDAEGQIARLKQLQDALPPVMNPSGTAKTVKALMGDGMTGGIGAMVAALMGHGGLATVMAGAAAHVGKLAYSESKDAARLGMLKFMSNSGPVNAPAFKAMIEVANAVIKGESLINKATKSVFDAGVKVLPQSVMPSPEKREKLDKKLQSLNQNPESLMGVGGDTGYYLPDHATSLAMTGSSAVQYLNSLRPDTSPKAPLDKPSIPSKAAKARYDRALDLAEQPLLIVESIKKGTLTPEDIQDVSTMYPALYSKITNKLMTDMTDRIAKGENIPYRTRLSLSLFMGQGLDSTMTPQSIIAFQPKGQQQNTHNQLAPQKGSMKSLGEISNMELTPQQARATNKREGSA